MNPRADRASRLDHLVAISGNEHLRTDLAEAPIEEIEGIIRACERATADISRYGRLHAEWLSTEFEIEDDRSS